MMKIGHRGAPLVAAENTLLSFGKALELGANAIECDVHLCKTGEPVVIHDKTLERTTAGRGLVKDHTLAELAALGVPSLKDTMVLLDGRAVLYIEIKANEAAQEVAMLVGTFAKTHGYAAYPVISFDREALLRVQALDAQILLGATAPQEGAGEAFLEQAARDGMWSVNPCIDTLEQDFVRGAHTRGLKVFTWTANTREDIARARTLHVDGIISDHAEWL